MIDTSGISAIILAAGLSTRMGRPKMLLPWKNSTILGAVITTLSKTGIEDMIVVTGAFQQAIEDQVQFLSTQFPVRSVNNPHYGSGEMLSSIQAGLMAIDLRKTAALITLGDQPQIQDQTLKLILSAYQISGASLIIPSYQMHRGHPWLVSSGLWSEIINLCPPHTSRDFLEDHHSDIQYVSIDNDSILLDIDTPADYYSQEPS